MARRCHALELRRAAHGVTAALDARVRLRDVQEAASHADRERHAL